MSKPIYNSYVLALIEEFYRRNLKFFVNENEAKLFENFFKNALLKVVKDLNLSNVNELMTTRLYKNAQYKLGKIVKKHIQNQNKKEIKKDGVCTEKTQ